MQARATTYMGSIPDDKALRRCLPRIKTAAQQVALERILPWHLKELKAAGLRGIQEAVDKGEYDKLLGVPFEQQAWTWIVKAANNAGKRLQASARAGELGPPPDEAVQKALETFSSQQWRDLIEKFEEQDLKALRTYLEANKEELEHSLGRRKYEIILVNVAKRGWILFLKQKLRYIPASDPMWVLLSRRWAREHNMKLGPRPSKKRSAAEMGSMRAIAESLSQQGRKVTDKKIATYIERMEQVPFDQFDGRAHDYFTMIADTSAYNRYLRSRQVD